MGDGNQRGSREWFDYQFGLLTTRGYDGFAANLRGSQRVRLTQVTRLIRERVTPPLRLVDVGCGTGELLNCLPRTWGDRRHGADLSRVALALARERGGPESWCQAEATRLPYRTGVFDGVICLEMWYYLDPAAQEAAVAEVDRILLPGGWLCCSTRLDDGHRYLTEERLRELLADRFTLMARTYHRVWLYRPLEQTALRVLERLWYWQRVARRLLAEEGPPGERQSWPRRWLAGCAARRELRWVVTGVIGVLAGLAGVVQRMLGATMPVWLAIRLGEWLFPVRSRTGVVYLLEKNDRGER